MARPQRSEAVTRTARPRTRAGRGASAPAVVGHARSAARRSGFSAPYALAALAALGQPTRLAIFRLLMRHQPGGLAASVIAETIGCAHNTLSSHLAILARAGLIEGRRDGRSIVYSADVDGMRALIDFLVTDCCGGRPELCRLAEQVTANCGEPASIRMNRKEVAT